MAKIKCKNRVFCNNSDNYRYIVTTYTNGYQGSWKKKTVLEGFNISVV